MEQQVYATVQVCIQGHVAIPYFWVDHINCLRPSIIQLTIVDLILSVPLLFVSFFYHFFLTRQTFSMTDLETAQERRYAVIVPSLQQPICTLDLVRKTACFKNLCVCLKKIMCRAFIVWLADTGDKLA